MKQKVYTPPENYEDVHRQGGACRSCAYRSIMVRLAVHERCWESGERSVEAEGLLI